MSGQKSHTHNPLADKPVLHSDFHEFNFKAEDQPLWISIANFLYSFNFTSIPFPSWHFQYFTR